MPSIITNNFKITLAKQVYNLLEIGANSYLPAEKKSYVYAFIGKQLPWNTGTEVAPTPQQSIVAQNDYYKRGIYAKQLSIENSSLVVPRINWTSGTKYREYDDTLALSDLASSNTTQNLGPIYVMNSDRNVYLCLSNNVSANSTVEPTGTSTSIITTTDGYRWKYVYTIPVGSVLKFFSNEYMPVLSDVAVQSEASEGEIDTVIIGNTTRAIVIKFANEPLELETDPTYTETFYYLYLKSPQFGVNPPEEYEIGEQIQGVGGGNAIIKDIQYFSLVRDETAN